MRRRDGEIEFDAGQFRGRARFLAGLLAFTALVLVGRSVQLQVLDRQLIERQADMRHARTARLVAHRGAVQDRFGEPLAVSSPVDTVWVNPPEFAEAGEGIPRLARALGINRQWLEQRVTSNLDREFLYVERHIEPAQKEAVRKLGLPGVYFQREYKRFYPNAEVTGHLLGFTSLDEAGQEGLELAFDRTLKGTDGAKRVIQDGRGRVIQNVEVVSAPAQGQDLVTSIDLRIQYLAYRELKSAIRQHRARAGTVIVLDIATGEVLAMVNQPSFNPNDRGQYEVARYRNRAVTDIFEPGSSIKPFFLAAALDSGRPRSCAGGARRRSRRPVAGRSVPGASPGTPPPASTRHPRLSVGVGVGQVAGQTHALTGGQRRQHHPHRHRVAVSGDDPEASEAVQGVGDTAERLAETEGLREVDQGPHRRAIGGVGREPVGHQGRGGSDCRCPPDERVVARGRDRPGRVVNHRVGPGDHRCLRWRVQRSTDRRRTYD